MLEKVMRAVKKMNAKSLDYDFEYDLDKNVFTNCEARFEGLPKNIMDYFVGKFSIIKNKELPKKFSLIVGEPESYDNKDGIAVATVPRERLEKVPGFAVFQRKLIDRAVELVAEDAGKKEKEGIKIGLVNMHSATFEQAEGGVKFTLIASGICYKSELTKKFKLF